MQKQEMNEGVRYQRNYNGVFSPVVKQSCWRRERKSGRRGKKRKIAMNSRRRCQGWEGVRSRSRSLILRERSGERVSRGGPGRRRGIGTRREKFVGNGGSGGEDEGGHRLEICEESYLLSEIGIREQSRTNSARLITDKRTIRFGALLSWTKMRNYLAGQWLRVGSGYLSASRCCCVHSRSAVGQNARARTSGRTSSSRLVPGLASLVTSFLLFFISVSFFYSTEDTRLLFLRARARANNFFN